MSALSARFRQSAVGRWFHGRDHGEQRIIAGLTLFVVVALTWALVWQPVADWRTVEQNRQHNAQALLDWLKANEQAERQAARQPAAQSGSKIRLITRSATAHGLTLNRLQPESNGIISVALQAQEFNKMISWVAQLEESQQASVERASFDGQDAPGYVNAQIRLN